jgi:dGTPase
LQISARVLRAMTALREFLYENVYRSPQVHNEFVKAKKILSELYEYFMGNHEVLKKELTDMDMAGCVLNGEPRERIVCDLVASMTDRSAMNLYEKIFFPSPLV